MKNYKSKLPILRLVKEPTEIQNSKVTCSADVASIARGIWSDDIGIFESLYAIYLNRESNTVGVSKISQGGIAGTVVDIRLILKYALDVLATNIILAHNHPSGNAQPSSSDIESTKRCRDAAKLMDMNLVDHIILTENQYLSMADEGII